MLVLTMVRPLLFQICEDDALRKIWFPFPDSSLPAPLVLVRGFDAPLGMGRRTRIALGATGNRVEAPIGRHRPRVVWSSRANRECNADTPGTPIGWPTFSAVLPDV